MPALTNHMNQPRSLAILARVPSVALFLQRVQSSHPAFALTPANAAIIATICAQLDGLPLALELAAAQALDSSPEQVLASLERHRLTTLAGNVADLPDRLTSVRASLAWSYDLLNPKFQQIFRRLAVFAGGAELEAVEAIVTMSLPVAAGCASQEQASQDGNAGASTDFPASPEQALIALARQSLVRLDRSSLPPAHTLLSIPTGAGAELARLEGGSASKTPHEVAHEPHDDARAGGRLRISLLETVRAYAWERLREAGLSSAATTWRHNLAAQRMPAEERDQERLLARLRTSLGATAFEAAWQTGAAWSLDQAAEVAGSIASH